MRSADKRPGHQILRYTLHWWRRRCITRVAAEEKREEKLHHTADTNKHSSEHLTLEIPLTRESTSLTFPSLRMHIECAWRQSFLSAVFNFIPMNKQTRSQRQSQANLVSKGFLVYPKQWFLVLFQKRQFENVQKTHRTNTFFITSKACRALRNTNCLHDPGRSCFLFFYRYLKSHH